MPSALAVRSDRRPAPVTDWPGRPTTAAGLLRVLLELDIDQAGADYQSLREDLPDIHPQVIAVRQPARPNGMPRARRSGIVHRRFPAGAYEAARVLEELEQLLSSVPAVIDALRAITGSPREPDPTAAIPLYVPDHVSRTVVDAGTGAAAPADRHVEWPADADDPTEGVSVPWWPAPAPYALALGIPLQHCAPGMTDWNSPDLISYGWTMNALDRARANYGAAAGVMAQASRGRPERAVIAGQAARYRAWHQQLAVIADQVAADWAASVQARRDALNILMQSEGSTMPTLSSTPAAIANLATAIRERIEEGQSGRINTSGSEVAFGYAVGLPRTLASYVVTSQSESRHVDVLRAADAGTPTGSVAEGGTKPNAVTFTGDELDLVKYAGIGVLSTEKANWISNIEQALAQVMLSRVLRGIEADLIVALAADAGLTATGATITDAVLQGIAQVAGAGGQAGVLALSATDWVTLMSAPGSSGGYINVADPAAGPAPTWMGLATAICPTLTAGSAFVLDPRSVTVVEAAGAPLLIVDLASQLGTNDIRIAVETWACGYVANPGGACEVTVTP